MHRIHHPDSYHKVALYTTDLIDKVSKVALQISAIRSIVRRGKPYFPAALIDILPYLPHYIANPVASQPAFCNFCLAEGTFAQAPAGYLNNANNRIEPNPRQVHLGFCRIHQNKRPTSVNGCINNIHSPVNRMRTEHACPRAHPLDSIRLGLCKATCHNQRLTGPCQILYSVNHSICSDILNCACNYQIYISTVYITYQLVTVALEQTSYHFRVCHACRATIGFYPDLCHSMSRY